MKDLIRLLVATLLLLPVLSCASEPDRVKMQVSYILDPMSVRLPALVKTLRMKIYGTDFTFAQLYSKDELDKQKLDGNGPAVIYCPSTAVESDLGPNTAISPGWPVDSAAPNCMIPPLPPGAVIEIQGLTKCTKSTAQIATVNPSASVQVFEVIATGSIQLRTDIRLDRDTAPSELDRIILRETPSAATCSVN